MFKDGNLDIKSVRAGCFSTKANIAREHIYCFKENNLINSAGFPYN